MKKYKNIKPVHIDDRGKIIDILDDEIFSHAGICTFNKGAIRANHYHKKTVQLNYILSGRILYRSKNLTKDNSPLEELILKEGDMIESGILEWHSMEALDDSVLLFFTRKNREDGGYESDTFRISIKEIENYNKLEI